MNKDVLFSHNKDDWATPQDFFDKLNDEFHFTLDPCADTGNAKCSKFYTVSENGLQQDWQGETVFCNPPYSQAKHWIKKCYDESRKSNTTVVMLIPARTDTIPFHKYIYHDASEFRFVKGRLKFGGASTGAPFPSMVVVFKKEDEQC